MWSRLKIFWVVSLLLASQAYAVAQSLSPGAIAFDQLQAAGGQEQAQARLMGGVNLYSQGKWREAVSELRRAQAEAPGKELRGEALFWISLSELSAGEYEQSLRDMDALEETDPGSQRLKELPYHRGRVLYYLGNYNDAIVLFRIYMDSFPADTGRKAAACYWTGECLFSMGQLDKAGDFFRLITEDYPSSPKYEASVYRLAMINQKKVETELLGLLKWSHEDSLRNMEEYHRRESAYDQALSAYQKRIADMQKDTRLQDLEDSNNNFREQLVLAEERIRSLENTLKESSSTREQTGGSDPLERLKAMRTSAQELENLIRESGR